MTIAEAIYLLCALTSLAAAGLLLRHYRARRTPLLFWTAIAFFGLSLNNILLFVDLSLVRDVDFAVPRTAVGTAAMIALVFGLVQGSRA